MEQEASILGDGNTIVQIVGDGNSIVQGHPYLTLTRYVARRGVREGLGLLSPYSRSTALLGRAGELDSLRVFLHSDKPLAARVLIGDGGSGKTRLALELCEEISAQGWNAGFVGRSELGRFFAHKNLSGWGWQKPTLIVIDYAAEHAELLSACLTELCDRSQPAPHPLRLLLLERHASMETGWCYNIFASGGYGAASKRALLDPPAPLPIYPLVQVDDRLALMRDMLQQAGAAGSAIVLPDDDAFRNKLMLLTWGGQPLFLMMAALVMIKQGYARALALGRMDLADLLAEREANRLRDLAKARALDPELVVHLAACVTLAQGMCREAFEEFATTEKSAIHRPSNDTAILADLLCDALQRLGGIAPVLPELIGEALILRTLCKRKDAKEVVLRCYSLFRRPVTESLVRCAQDFSEQQPIVLHCLDAIIQAIGDNYLALAEFNSSLPAKSIALNDFNLKVAEHLVTFHSLQANLPIHIRASELSNLSNAQALSGKHEAALLTAIAATEFYRELATQQPNMLHSALAMSLNDLAIRHINLGQLEQAFPAAQEAVKLCRCLAEQWPEMFLSDLATSLNNLAGIYSGQGQRGPALRTMQEVVTIRRGLKAQSSDVHAPNLAGSLNNLACMYSKLGQCAPALTIAKEAVDLYRTLAAQQPDMFLSDLASSLSNLSDRFGELGQSEPGSCAAREAVAIYQKINELRPGIFLPGLAGALNNLTNRLAELELFEDSLCKGEETVTLYRKLVSELPHVYRADLAGSLTNLASVLGQLHRLELAQQLATEAVDLYQNLVDIRPDFFLPNLAGSLTNLASILSEHGQHERALCQAQKATNIYRDISIRFPQAFLPCLAGSLHNLSRILGKLGRRKDALITAHNAVVMLTSEFLSNPPAHSSLMEMLLRYYLQLCKSAYREPDHRLLKPLLPYFNRKATPWIFPC